MDKDLNSVHSVAPKSEDVLSCRDDYLVELNDPSSLESGQAHHASNSKKATSCRHDDLKQIKNQLTARSPSKLKIISIVGMGGIGKTTLARSIYEDTEISYHFHLRGWITISQEYNLRNILVGLLRSVDSTPHKEFELENEELEEVLYRSLKGRRYLIVLDDMWSTEVWKVLKLMFPNDNNGSRIILTSRDKVVATYPDLDGPPHFMNCLSNDESWRLLCNEVFVGKPCPFDLVEIGKDIAKKCQGLPLAIVVIAGHLSKIDKNQACWADVEKRLDSIITGSQEQILDILCLSYSYLPQHMKACFLYMAIFPKNSNIRAKKLIRLWSAVGFLPAECSENVEDVAEKCLNDLISRNLIMITTKKYNGNGPAKTCGIHDLLWDLSLRECKKSGHYIFGQDLPWDFSLAKCRHGYYFPNKSKYLRGLTSTYLCCGCFFGNNFSLIKISEYFRLLKVLDIQNEISFYHFPDEVTQIVNLRYLQLASYGNIPGSVSKLRNLETLINNHELAGPNLPEEIWLLQRLRHLHVGTCTFLPNTSNATVDGSSISVLPDLETLSTLSFASCTKQVFSSIPNLKNLKIHEMGEDAEHLFDCLSNLVCLQQLEKLHVYFSTEIGRRPKSFCRDTFPPSVKQLTLVASHLPWEDMNILAMLPNLEVLKLKNDAFIGPVCEQTLEGFPRLKVLLFDHLHLDQWIAETIHFPVLQHLVLRRCPFLEAIPYCFGEIPTLNSIEMFSCSGAAIESARSIQQEQQSMGNYDLQVHISWTVKQEWFKLESYDDKIKQKAMEKVSGLSGVESVELDEKNKTMIIVIGDVDTEEILHALREVCPVDFAFHGHITVKESAQSQKPRSGSEDWFFRQCLRWRKQLEGR